MPPEENLNPGATPENENPKPDADPQDDIPDGLGDKGKEALKRERDARKAAEKLAQDNAAELARLRQEKAAAEAERAKAAEEEAARKGEFEKLATDRAEKLTAATAELKAKDDEIAAYEALIAPMVETLAKELPKEALDGYDAEQPMRARLAWLRDRERLVKALTPADPTKPKVPMTPRPNGAGKPDDEASRQAHRRQTVSAF